MKTLRFVLLPIGFFYGCIVYLHRRLYLLGILKSFKFHIPLINVGNLSLGGTGKSPHVEYIHNIINLKLKTAIVSRGYNRKSKGVILVNPDSQVKDVGDEPIQFKYKFPDTPIIVAERRSKAIQKLVEDKTIKCILLDDAFQHWSIISSLNILLTTYKRPFFKDSVVPAGRLREFKNGYKRANIIIVSKCPIDISEEQKTNYLEKINVFEHQKVFFSTYKYLDPYALLDPTKKIELSDLRDKSFLLVSAIADTSYLEKYIKTKTPLYEHLKFADHHYFSKNDMKRIKQKSKDNYILTTEKDATRLLVHKKFIINEQLKIYVLQIKVEIAFGEADIFKSYLLKQIARIC